VIPGLFTTPNKAYFLGDANRKPLGFERKADAIVISLGKNEHDPYATVIALEFPGKAEVANPPTMTADMPIFIDQLDVKVQSSVTEADIRYTTDGTEPDTLSPRTAGVVRLSESGTLSTRLFAKGKAISGTSQKSFLKVAPRRGMEIGTARPGLTYSYYEGDWDRLPDFSALRPIRSGTVSNFTFSPRVHEEHFGFVYSGYVQIPETGVYTFATSSDDGSCLFIDDSLVVDNDGLHGMQEANGYVALAKGYHEIRVTFFEKTGGDGLKVYFTGPGVPRQEIPDSRLFQK